MYEWLTGALQDEATVITANRRLARVLLQDHSARQLASGVNAWRSPAIMAWPDWLDAQLQSARGQQYLPTRINQHQSQLLWERCLARELGERVTGKAQLVRLARETWQRLADWDVSIQEVARRAQSDDQRLFVAAAGRYLGILERERWIDNAGLGHLVLRLANENAVDLGGHYTFAGFERQTPLVAKWREALIAHDCRVQDAPVGESGAAIALQACKDADAELRAAGRWARRMLEEDPARRIAIVVNQLEQNATRAARLVREGFVPGWQCAAARGRDAVNVSYGRRLLDYPAVGIGLLLLRWLVRDLNALEIGQLLRSPLLLDTDTAGRTRLEMRLRMLPDRAWSPSMLSAALRGKDESSDAAEWLGRVAGFTKLRRELPRSQSPADWAIFIDAALAAWQWPGGGTLDSNDFQVVNRWRDLLNDLARIDLVSPRMNLDTALSRLETMAAETLFQPESDDARLQVLGPLEASGARFDALWITGLSAADWPPAANPSPLVSRPLQIERGMPDAVPADTVAYAERVLNGLCGAADTVVCSYPETADDAAQAPSELLLRLQPVVAAVADDPGWGAAEWSGRKNVGVANDRVPRIAAGEDLGGGAATLQRQMTDPIAAFICGRLGIRLLQPQVTGLPPLLRGNIIHDALFNLYRDKPSREELAAWTSEQLDERIAQALDFAFSHHERFADPILRALLVLERDRVAPLLRGFVAADSTRDEFMVVDLEQAIALVEGEVRLQLRADRIDEFDDGSLAILDYKTGAAKKFLLGDGEPRDFQLVAYACASDAPVAALALANIDTREISFDGIGRGFSAKVDLAEALPGWRRQVEDACAELALGDVRLNREQTVADARELNLLTRFTELRRDY